MSAAVTRPSGGNIVKGRKPTASVTISDLTKLQLEWENEAFSLLLAPLCASSTAGTFRCCCRWSVYSKRLLVGLQDANMAAKHTFNCAKDVEVSKGTADSVALWVPDNINQNVTNINIKTKAPQLLWTLVLWVKESWGHCSACSWRDGLGQLRETKQSWNDRKR